MVTTLHTVLAIPEPITPVIRSVISLSTRCRDGRTRAADAAGYLSCSAWQDRFDRTRDSDVGSVDPTYFNTNSESRANVS